MLHTIGQLNPGGAEIQLVRMLCHDKQDDVEHGIACFWRTEHAHIETALAKAGVPVFYLDKSRHFDPGFVVRLARLVRRWKPDVIHGWLSSGSMWGRLGGILAGRPAMVAAFRSDNLFLFPGSQWLDLFLARYTQFGIVNSKRVQQLIRDHLDWPESRVVQIANGLDTTVFSPERPDPERRKRLGLPESGTIVVMVGRLTEVKNWPMFVSVAQIVAEARSNVCFVGVGRTEDPDSVYGKVKDLVDKYGLGPNRIRFLGQRRDVNEILAQSNLSVLTSDYEGMPNVVLEAMSCALPVIATRVSGTEELVADDKTGFLVAPGDAEGMAEHILYCIDHPKRTEAIGRQAREFVVENFSFEKMAKEHRDVYLAAARRRWPGRRKFNADDELPQEHTG